MLKITILMILRIKSQFLNIVSSLVDELSLSIANNSIYSECLLKKLSL